MVDEYHIQNIHRLLINGFDEQELKQFCRYNPSFRPMHLKLSKIKPLTEVAAVLIDFAKKEELLGTLLEWVQEDNPVAYTNYQPYIIVKEPQLEDDFVTIPGGVFSGEQVSEKRINIAALRKILATYFNDSELRDLCFDLKIEYEDLSGQAKTDKARELVAYVQRHGHTVDLMTRCHRLRPNLDWQTVAQTSSPELLHDFDIELRRILSKPDYSTRIQSIIHENPIGKSRTALAAIAFNIGESAGIRIRALQECIPLGDIEPEKWSELFQEPSTELLAGVISTLTSSNIDFDEDQVHILLANPQLPCKEYGLGEMITQLVRRNDHTSAIFLPAASQKAWEIRLDCIRAIIKLDDEKSLETLFTFIKTTRYWLARHEITKYLLRRASEGRLSSKDREIAIQILTQIVTDGKTDPNSGTMIRAKEALELIQSYDLVKGIQIVKHNDKIRILFLAANPTDSTRLRLDEENRAIDQALRQAEFRDKFDIRQQWAVRVSDLQELLLRHKPDIVHFSGHGSTSSEIILEDNFGNSSPVPIHALSRLFFVLKDNIKCVVLNACYSDQQAEVISKSIDCVVGMSKTIGNEASVGFVTAFYQALAFGRNVETAFELGCLQIDLEDLNEQDIPKLLTTKNASQNIVFVKGVR